MYIKILEAHFCNNFTFYAISIYLLINCFIHFQISSNLHSRKPAIWLEFSAHAREWISQATGLNLIQTVRTNSLDNHIDYSGWGMEKNAAYFFLIISKYGIMYPNWKEFATLLWDL